LTQEVEQNVGPSSRILSLIIILVLIKGVSVGAFRADEPLREVTIFFTNGFHSAFDLIPPYWLKGKWVAWFLLPLLAK
jgi:hypothetical protein